ncbi:MAG: hypothetical protein KatS3mg111_1326 [Pirellulaceae bacterium]|nr:MAG: hypothetical protein KatS3mg111_1326 [Pirellulaceae bacterium]
MLRNRTLDGDVCVLVHRIANLAEDRFEISAGLFESLGIDCQRRTDDHQRCTVIGSGNRLIDGQASYRLHGNIDGGHDLCQFV